MPARSKRTACAGRSFPSTTCCGQALASLNQHVRETLDSSELEFAERPAANCSISELIDGEAQILRVTRNTCATVWPIAEASPQRASRRAGLPSLC